VVQAIFLDDLTDRRRPLRSRTWTPRSAIARIDGRLESIRGRSAGVDLTHSRRPHFRPEHYDGGADCEETLQTYKDLQDIIAILGIDELSEDPKVQ